MGTVTAAGYPVSADDVAWIALDDLSAVGTARRTANRLAQGLEFSETRVGEVGIGVTEVATNLHLHAIDGALLLRVLRIGREAAVEMVALDRGPGMADVAWAQGNGHSTSGTLGIGLGAVARLATECDVLSLAGRGTVTAATFWPASAPEPAPVELGGLTRPISGESECGDAWAAHVGPEVSTVLLCDGLGHGPLAASAAAAAVAVFRSDPTLGPGDLLAAMHGPLAHTRGVAAAAVQMRHREARLLFAGVGNVGAAVFAAGRQQRLLSQPGIVGHRSRPVRVVDMPAPEGALLVLHSDGLTDRFDLADYPGFGTHRVLSLAGALLRDAGLHRDDSSVLVVRLP